MYSVRITLKRLSNCFKKKKPLEVTPEVPHWAKNSSNVTASNVVEVLLFPTSFLDDL